MTKKNPVSFKDLSEDQLREAARYFGTEDEGPVPVLLADLVENGVEWELYKSTFLKPVEEEKPAPNVVVSDDLRPLEEVVEVEEVVTAPAVPVLVQANYLIKMNRANPLFEFKHYAFTQKNPYQIMDAKDAQEILSKETGFRQAFPDELQEYYS